jgi:hypothetical protein
VPGLREELRNWRQIAVYLFDTEKGEGKAHACDNACYRQLTTQPFEFPLATERVMPQKSPKNETWL